MRASIPHITNSLLSTVVERDLCYSGDFISDCSFYAFFWLFVDYQFGLTRE